MTDTKTETLSSAYLIGVLHADLTMIRNDLHMADHKAALLKVNDALKILEEKVAGYFQGRAEHAEQDN